MTPEAHRRLDVGDEAERPTITGDIWSWAHVVYEVRLFSVASCLKLT